MSRTIKKLVCANCGSENVVPSLNIPTFKCVECKHIIKYQTVLEQIDELFRTGYFDWVNLRPFNNVKKYILDSEDARKIFVLLNNSSEETKNE